ncbi:hypothetical protein [Curtobacterium sp. 20TX0008]|uniref:hypothetical protein n=1 Tax=Curtobacterium sp. 20TX0008 TaxID=3022018 RepID=UPI00232C69D8|nr:hypothetical protein [Curtobacterium sp. 20TX0008]MDB6426706.1 hypothetical protein [Curtobacterium sp. 20TX0008]
MEEPKAESGPARRVGWRFYRALGLVVVVASVALVGPFALSWIDAAIRVQIICSVEAAEPLKGGSVTRAGSGTSFNEIEITTSDCGKLLLRRGVTAENASELAGQLMSGGNYRFEAGQGSYAIRSVLRLIGRDVTVERPVQVH